MLRTTPTSPLSPAPDKTINFLALATSPSNRARDNDTPTRDIPTNLGSFSQATHPDRTTTTRITSLHHHPVIRACHQSSSPAPVVRVELGSGSRSRLAYPGGPPPPYLLRRGQRHRLADTPLPPIVSNRGVPKRFPKRIVLPLLLPPRRVPAGGVGCAGCPCFRGRCSYPPVLRHPRRHSCVGGAVVVAVVESGLELGNGLLHGLGATAAEVAPPFAELREPRGRRGWAVGCRALEQKGTGDGGGGIYLFYAFVI